MIRQLVTLLCLLPSVIVISPSILEAKSIMVTPWNIVREHDNLKPITFTITIPPGKKGYLKITPEQSIQDEQTGRLTYKPIKNKKFLAGIKIPDKKDLWVENKTNEDIKKTVTIKLTKDWKNYQGRIWGIGILLLPPNDRDSKKIMPKTASMKTSYMISVMVRVEFLPMKIKNKKYKIKDLRYIPAGNMISAIIESKSNVIKRPRMEIVLSRPDEGNIKHSFVVNSYSGKKNDVEYSLILPGKKLFVYSGDIGKLKPGVYNYQIKIIDKKRVLNPHFTKKKEKYLQKYKYRGKIAIGPGAKPAKAIDQKKKAKEEKKG